MPFGGVQYAFNKNSFERGPQGERGPGLEASKINFDRVFCMTNSVEINLGQIAGIALPAENAVRQRAKSPCGGRSVSYMFHMKF